jgi:hypothetical protein
VISATVLARIEDGAHSPADGPTIVAAGIPVGERHAY